MKIRTLNTLYTLTDAGDGGWLISGHARYCPNPTLVTLVSPVDVGARMVFRYVQPPPGVRSHVITTAVQEITG